LNFVRKKKRGMNQKVERYWFSDCGQYRIYWIKEAFGVAVQPHYQACVLCLQSIDLPVRQWDFAGRRGPYKTMGASVQACEQHQKNWEIAIAISEGERPGRSEKLRTLEHRSRVKSIRDKKVVYQRTMSGTPVWVRNRANSALMNFFFPRGKKQRVEDEEEAEEEAEEEVL